MVPIHGGEMNLFPKFLTVIFWSGVLTICLSSSVTWSNELQATGYLDLRPSWITKTGGFTTENTAEMGARITQDTSISYMQGFNTNLFDPLSPEVSSGVRLELSPGAVRTKINNLWRDDRAGLSLSYENRVYLPIDAASRERGFVTALRNYIKLSKSFSNTLTLTLSDAVIPIIHSRSGNVSPMGLASPNGVFENRIQLETDLQLTEKLSISLPLMFHQTKLANFRADAIGNDSWTFYICTSPEIDYAVSENLTLGLAYYNIESFFNTNLSKSQFGQALESGEFQFVLTASL